MVLSLKIVILQLVLQLHMLMPTYRSAVSKHTADIDNQHMLHQLQ